MSATAKNRVDGQLAYVLHAHPFKETSLVVEVFSRHYGRLGVVARGARRPRSAMRGLLMAFQPLELGWFGQGELRTLAKVEWQGGQPLLPARALLPAYYLNELLLRLLPREDAHPRLFEGYSQTLQQLARSPGEAVILRRFEKMLLKELGYDPTLDREAQTGFPVQAEKFYAFLPEQGPIQRDERSEDKLFFSGKALLAMARDDFSEMQTLVESKQLMRLLIQHHLGSYGLNSRRVFKELQEL